MKNNLEDELQTANAQISLIKSRLKKIEKENDSMRKELSDLHRSKIEERDEFVKKIELFERESQMKNTSSSNKIIGSESTSNSNKITIRYILKSSLNINNIFFTEEFNKLKFFRDYFFDDFYSIESEDITPVLNQIISNEKLFVDLFLLFSCKKEICENFISKFFSLSFFISEKVYFLENVPVEWIVSENAVNPLICDFIDKNYTFLTRLFINVAESHPFILQSILSKNEFNEILESRSAKSLKLTDLICRKKIGDYIDHQNIHMIPIKCLKDLFEKDYIQIN